MALDTASTTPPKLRAADAERTQAPAAPEDIPASVLRPSRAGGSHTGSLSRRMMLIAAGWIFFLLLVGGVALDRTLAGLIEKNFDDQLEYMLTAMIGAAEIDDQSGRPLLKPRWAGVVEACGAKMD